MAGGARHYLDHAATTDVRPEAATAFADELTRTGNAASSHAEGRAARARLDEARERLAAALGADPAEVLFTSGGTEADNLAVKGAFYAARARRHGDARAVADDPPPVPLVISAIEHAAVAEAASWLAAHEGAEVRVLPALPDGRVDVAALPALLGTPAGDGGPGTRPAPTAAGAPALLSVMLANNETGVLQPLPQVVAAARAAGVPVHTDAVQAVGVVPVRFHDLGVDALTVSGHKVGAPVGSGALVARRDLALHPVEHGGGQERSVRSGTLAVAGARALAVAVEAAVAERESHAAHLAHLRDRLLTGLARRADDLPGLRPTVPTGPAGPPGPDGVAVLPGHVHLLHPGARAEAVLFALDAAGVAASSGSACHAGVEQPSAVLLAMGYDGEDARSALRLTLGRTSTEADVDALVAALPGALRVARDAHPAARRAARAARAAGASSPAPATPPAPATRRAR